MHKTCVRDVWRFCMMSGESYAGGKDNSLHGSTATLVNSIICEEVASLDIMFRNFSSAAVFRHWIELAESQASGPWILPFKAYLPKLLRPYIPDSRVIWEIQLKAVYLKFDSGMECICHLWTQSVKVATVLSIPASLDRTRTELLHCLVNMYCETTVKGCCDLWRLARLLWLSDSCTAE